MDRFESYPVSVGTFYQYRRKKRGLSHLLGDLFFSGVSQGESDTIIIESSIIVDLASRKRMSQTPLSTHNPFVIERDQTLPYAPL